MLHISRPRKDRWRIAATVLALTGALALAGCGKKAEAPAVVGQVIAHVGPDDVTQQELDNELRLANVPADKRTDEVDQGDPDPHHRTQVSRPAGDRRPSSTASRPSISICLRSREQHSGRGLRPARRLGSKVSAHLEERDRQLHPGASRPVRKAPDLQHRAGFLSARQDMDALAAATKDFKTIDQVEGKLNEFGIKYSRGPGALDSATMPAADAQGARRPESLTTSSSSARETTRASSR